MVGFFQNGVRQLVAGQRSGGNNRPSEVFAGKLADFFMSDADERMAFDLLRYQGCKTVPVDGQRAARGNFRLVGAFHNQRPGTAHFFMHQAHGVVQIIVRAQGI